MSNGSLILENVNLKNVGIAVQGARSVIALAGTTGPMTIAAWGQGHISDGTGSHTAFQGPIPPFSRPSGLLDGQKYYERSKPSYADIPVSRFLSARTYGATGNGVVDDTKALQKAVNGAASAGKVLFIDAGIYKVTDTLYIPTGSKIVGESYPVIMSSGSYFANIHAPKPVVQVGRPGSVGCVEWSDMVVATQGYQPGAILIEWNLETSGTPSGMWDVHTRIGGFKGSNLQLADCPATPALPSEGTSGGNSSMPTAPFSNATASSSPSPTYSNSTGGDNITDTSYINKACIAAFMSMHITPSASGLYMENNWFWTADHDLDSVFTNITVYSGRGLYIESERGDIWLYALHPSSLPSPPSRFPLPNPVIRLLPTPFIPTPVSSTPLTQSYLTSIATSSEHHSLYQFQFSHTRSLFASQLQIETAYYQPHPDISAPFPASAPYNDPTASELCTTQGTNCDGLGLRMLQTRDVGVYSAGLYSFFRDYNNCESPSSSLPIPIPIPPSTPAKSTSQEQH